MNACPLHDQPYGGCVQCLRHALGAIVTDCGIEGSLRAFVRLNVDQEHVNALVENGYLLVRTNLLADAMRLLVEPAT